MDEQVRGTKIGNGSDIKIHSKGLNYDTNALTFSNNRENIGKAIRNMLDDIEKQKKSADFLRAIYAHLGELSKKSFSIDEVKIDSSDYFSLTDYSKKKLLVKKFIDKYPDKKKRKQVLKNAITIQGWDSDIIESLKGIGLDPVLLNLAELFTRTNNIEMRHLTNSFVNEMDIPYQYTFIELLKNCGAEGNLVQWFEQEIGKSEGSNAILKDNEKIKTEEVSSLLKIESSERKATSDFNPMIYDMDLNLGLKLFSLNRFKEIYNKLFFQIVKDIASELGLEEPCFNELLSIQKSKFKGKFEESKEEKEEKSIFQYTIEWELADDFDDSMLIEISKMLNSEGSEFNLNPISEVKVFNHPVKTSEGTQKYKGHFENSGKGFLGESIIIIENQRPKSKKLRLTLNNFTQNDYIYFLTQISYFIKHKKFIDKNQLYFNIFDRYNKEVYGSNTNHDITFFDKQYKSLMEKVIIPLSYEGKDLGIKAHNTLLAGLYGSGKSQFLLKLLKDKKFTLNGKEFNLNANVVYIDLQTFKAMLATPIGGVRTKLDEIYQKTNAPILLVIEDIDTLVNEKMYGVNDEIAQAMTLFFEGIGSIPINVVATANEPSKLSERLIRPNRIYEIIEFYLPETQEEKLKILNIHLNINQVEISDKTKEKLLETRVFKEGTASHIATFCNQLKARIKIQEILGDKSYTLGENEILEIAASINISSKDIKETIVRIKKWVEDVTGNSKGLSSIGFVQAES